MLVSHSKPTNATLLALIPASHHERFMIPFACLVSSQSQLATRISAGGHARIAQFAFASLIMACMVITITGGRINADKNPICRPLAPMAIMTASINTGPITPAWDSRKFNPDVTDILVCSIFALCSRWATVAKPFCQFQMILGLKTISAESINTPQCDIRIKRRTDG